MKQFYSTHTSQFLDLSFAVLLTILFMIPQIVVAQVITGTIIDDSDGFGMPGASVIVLDGSRAMVGGVVTNQDGLYRVTVSGAGTYTVTARFVGYQEMEQSVRVTASGTVTLNFALSQTGFELNTVVVAASRRQEKALDAPASISVLNAEEVANHVGTSAIEVLRNTTGVDMSQTGVDRREMVLRGFNNAFSGAAYILTDYRQASVPSLAVNVYSIMPAMNIDVDRIEVVRGPGSALYGPGVDQGVVHFLTKDPFRHPGTTLSISGGEQDYLGVQFRQAGVLGSKKNIGYKITGMYGQADEWGLDSDNKQDADQIALDGGPRDNDFEKINVNGSLEYRFGSNGSVVANGGWARFTSPVLSGIGTLQADDFGYTYGQLRLQIGEFFAQVYANKNDAGDSFVYGQDGDGDGENDIIVDTGISYNAQAQYNMSALDNRTQLIFGADLEFTQPDTDGTILGRNEVGGGADIEEYGAYVQATTELSPKFSLTVASRLDYNNVTEDVTVSPRAALVFKPARGHSIRATYNRAFNSPTTNSNFLDIQAGKLPGTDIIVRGRGSAEGFTFERDANGGLVAHSLLPNVLGQPQPVGLSLGDAYGAVWGGLALTPIADVTAQLQAAGFPVNEAATAFLVEQLSPANTSVSGFVPGSLGLLNLTTGEIERRADAIDVVALEASISQTFEVGYKGIVSNKLLFAVDAYYTQREDFVGPLLAESPFVLVADPTDAMLAAITEGIDGNPVLSGFLAGAQIPSAAVAAALVGFAGDRLPGKNAPVAIAQALENNPGIGVTPELMLAYRNFGEVDFFGVDASFQFIGEDGLKLFGNVSVVSDDFFDDGELEEDGTGLELALNAPAFKARLGGSYKLPNGLSFNVAGRYTDSFPVRSGPFNGTVENYFLVDLGVGFDFGEYAPGVRADLSVTNALDDEHREFVGAPQLGRMTILKLTYTRR